MNKLLFLYTNAFIEYELLKNTLNEYEVHYYPDLKKFENDNRKKIAVFVYVENTENLDNLPLIADMSSVDLLVLYHWDEVIKSPALVHRDITQSFNTEKYVVIVGGYNTIYQYNKDKFLTNNFSHGQIVKHNSQYKDTNQEKFYNFECLFGTVKPTRNYIFYKLLENNLLNRSVVNIQRTREDWINDRNHNLFWPNISEDFEKVYGKFTSYTSPIVNDLESNIINGLGVNLYDYLVDVVNNRKTGDDCYFTRAYNVPEAIFNITKYSLVAETYQSQIFHPTEKTAKMFLAKRVFIMFSCHNFLKNLQNMGFKTFDSIIDESYDQIDDTRKRFDYAFEQVKYLDKLDYKEVYSSVNDILEHNYNVMCDTNRQFNRISQFIDKGLR
jgi:hypothetical protein